MKIRALLIEILIIVLITEEFHNLYSLANIIKMTKLRKMRCAGHAACMGDECIQDSGQKIRIKETTGKT
jgi:hypothetical protein